MYNTAYTPKAVKREINPPHFCGNVKICTSEIKHINHNSKPKVYEKPLPFLCLSGYATSIHLLSSPSNWFTSWLSYGKQWSYPDYRHFLPPVFTAMPGMAALFTQARSSKLQIPHPHGICIMGYKSQGFLGEWFFPIQTEIKIIVHKLCNAVR